MYEDQIHIIKRVYIQGYVLKLKMQCVRTTLKNYLNRFYASTTTCILEELKHRSLIRVSGEDASGLLQGLVTNDILHMTSGYGVMYAMLLNNRGRVMYDAIISRPSLDNIYYLEVDKEAAPAVKKHLLTYRLRKQIDISIDNSQKVWVYFDPNSLENPASVVNTEDPKTKSNTANDETLPLKVTSTTIDEKQECYVFRDPRLAALGQRIIAPVDSDAAVNKLFPGKKGPLYKRFRYRLGVGEGLEELPPGNCFPLEANCDYLHGISFHKGCYIGQELTARTFHTGVIRKRLMPLFFDKRMLYKPAKNEPIIANDNNIGKLRGFEEDSGIALLRIQPALEAGKLRFSNKILLETQRPHWWPVELPKEKVAAAPATAIAVPAEK